ncbi:MAG: sigma-70 family RNA polymerase sigma factor [Atribacterota bacterium]
MVPRHLLHFWNKRLKEEGLGVTRPWKEIPLPPEKMDRLSRPLYRKRKGYKSLPLEVLSPKQREVVELLFYKGVSEGEAAKRLQISRRSVRVHKRRALAKLRVYLSQNCHNFPKESPHFRGTLQAQNEERRLES